MSRLDDKDKAARRRSKDKAIIKTRLKVAKSHGFTKLDGNRYNKRHPLDCGRSDCGVCHPNKKWGREKTIAEKKHEQKDKHDS